MTKDSKYVPVIHTCKQCNATWSGAERAHCCSCHKTFGSVYAFDKHRTGTYEPMERRCLTKAEMEEKKMARQKDGYWVTELMPEGAKGKRA